jgi:hypothetical protein
MALRTVRLLVKLLLDFAMKRKRQGSHFWRIVRRRRGRPRESSPKNYRHFGDERKLRMWIMIVGGVTSGGHCTIGGRPRLTRFFRFFSHTPTPPVAAFAPLFIFFKLAKYN